MEVQFLNWAKSYWSNWALGLKKRLRTKKELERKYREAARGEKEGEPAHLEEDDNEVGDRKVDEQKVHPGLALPCQPLPKKKLEISSSSSSSYPHVIHARKEEAQGTNLTTQLTSMPHTLMS